VKLFPNRKYASGTGIQWCFWRWSDAQLPYLDRLFLFKTPWFAASLNWIQQADDGDPHDHTSYFISILLKGWYIERRVTTFNTVPVETTRRVQFFNYMRGVAWDVHKIIDVSKGGCLTLCLMGPKLREWGNHKSDGTQVHWQQYKDQTS
jgi:hypothetical protein